MFSWLFGSSQDAYPSTSSAGAPACCPPESLPELPNPSGGQGVEHMVDGVDVYVSSPLTNAKSAVIVATDVFGWRAGHHRRFADQLGARLGNGYTVVVPDLFHGSPLIQPMMNHPTLGFLLGLPGMIYRLKTRDIPKGIDRDFGVLMPWLRAAGVERVSVVGFCFGAWVAGRMLASMGGSATTPIACGVGMHPSLQMEKMLIKGSSDVQLAKDIGATPFLLMPAGGDPASVKPGGDVCKVLSEARGVPEVDVSVPFEDMKHGWVARGDDAQDAAIARDQAKALELAAEFIARHAAPPS